MRNYKSIAYYLAILCTVIVLLLLIAGPFSYWCCMKQHVENDYYNYAACIVALLNAILLFITLIHQNKSFYKERFETTFFNLLERHRQITNEIVIETLTLNKNDITDNKLYSCKWKGRKSVYQVRYDVYWIKKALESSYHKGFYDSQEINQAEFAFDYMYDCSQWNLEDYYKKRLDEKDLHEDCQHKLINSIYGIRKDMIENANKQDIDSYAHQLYWNKWGFCWEHYMRSFQQILVHIVVNISKQKERKQYVGYVKSQLSAKELDFIRWHAIYDDNLMNYLEMCGLDK